MYHLIITTPVKLEKDKDYKEQDDASAGFIKYIYTLWQDRNTFQFIVFIFLSPEHSTIVLNGQKMHKDQLTVMMDRCKHLEEDLAEGDEVIKILRNKVGYK